MNHHNVRTLYEPRLLAARSRFREEVERPILDFNLDAAAFHCFLVRFCAIGVQMTEPVEGWIRRAGERCTALGFAKLGHALRMHARHEADHHLLMIADTHKLVDRWNANDPDAPFDADAMIASAPTAAVRNYAKLHEDVIASTTPFAQIAIEYEIEGLSVRFGPPLLDQCKRLLGPSILEGLSFLVEHVALDVGHTHFNEAELDSLLLSNPGCAGPLADAGVAALAAYGNFLTECFGPAHEFPPLMKGFPFGLASAG